MFFNPLPNKKDIKFCRRMILCPKCGTVRSSGETKCGICTFPIKLYIWLKNSLSNVQHMQRKSLWKTYKGGQDE